MKKVTTESIKSDNRVFGSYDVFDFLGILVLMMFAYALRIYVHPKLRVFFLIFSLFIALFLVSRSGLNVKRKNYESIYFFLMKDIAVYRPFYGKKEKKDEEI